METIRVGFLGTRGHTLKFINLINGFEESEAAAIWSDDPAMCSSAERRRKCLPYAMQS